MKYMFFIIALITLSFNGYSQKAKKVNASARKATILAKAENLTASLVEYNGSFALYLLSGKGSKIDSILVKAIVNKAIENLPADGKLTPFTAKGDKLYLLSWNEKSLSGDAKSRLENTTEIHSEIWDINSKAALYSNIQKVVNISEIIFLDPGKNASKTVEKIRREGFEFILLPDGDLTLKNKTQLDKLSYDSATKKYVPVKSAASAPKKK